MLSCREKQCSFCFGAFHATYSQMTRAIRSFHPCSHSFNSADINLELSSVSIWLSLPGQSLLFGNLNVIAESFVSSSACGACLCSSCTWRCWNCHAIVYWATCNSISYFPMQTNSSAGKKKKTISDARGSVLKS